MRHVSNYIALFYSFLINYLYNSLSGEMYFYPQTSGSKLTYFFVTSILFFVIFRKILRKAP